MEYDLEPQGLALDVASGAVDLALESQLLGDPARRASAESEATRLMVGATDRIDANRTARMELQDLLGEASRPWLGTTLHEQDLDEALEEVATLATAGFDLLRIEVPIGRELAMRMENAGLDVPEWQPRGLAGHAPIDPQDDGDPAPAGSQRALAHLRRVADGVAAERRGYVRLATSVPALGIPDHAVVAAFERIDLAEADPLTEIVAGGVDPDRSLADHAFARRLHRRAQTLVGVGAGPLIVAPDLAVGVPSDAVTRSGRALACQLLSVALAVGDGVSADRTVIGAYPPWLTEEPDAVARVIAEVAVRRAIFPAQTLRFDEPEAPDAGSGANTSTAWPFIASAALTRSGETAVIMRRRDLDPRRSVAEGRAAGGVAAGAVTAGLARGLDGVAAAHAVAVIAVALRTLDELAERGWRAIVHDVPDPRAVTGLGGDAVAERTEAFDPLTVLDGGNLS